MVVDNNSDSHNIIPSLAKKSSYLYSSISYSDTDMTFIDHELARCINYIGFNDSCIVQHFEVMGAVGRLKLNKKRWLH